MTTRRALAEASIAGALAFVMSLIVFAPIMKWIAAGWSGGDMLSTYVNAEVWQGFNYRVTDQFGFPLGMNLNYFPGIDITENTFAQIITNLTGQPFIGINLLIILSFPLVAFLTYFLIRMTGLTGALAITFAVVFSLIPYHWGRALGHTYLSTLYSAVTGMAFVLLIGSGRWQHLVQAIRSSTSPRRTRIGLGLTIAAMIIVTAWTGVYYVAFTLILGAAALIWRIAHRATMRALVTDALPLIAVAALAIIGFLPSILATRADPPLAQLSERLPYDSVVFAGNLAVALLPLPQSSLPGMGQYNSAVMEAIAAGGWTESTAITNHGTWITSLALLVLVIGLILNSRRPSFGEFTNQAAPLVSLHYITYLIVVTLLFFIPWGLNYLLAGTVTAQIRAWNRLVPVLLLLFLLGAAAVLARTQIARRFVIAIPIALVVLALTAVDSVYPFQSAYGINVPKAAKLTKAAREYAIAVNAAIPDKCGILQLPHMQYPEFGVVGGVNDYDHFWTSLANPGKGWSYGAVKNTDAGVWSAQLPEIPTAEQISLLRASGFCAIHLDTRAYISEKLPEILGDLGTRYGDPVATGLDGKWLLFDVSQTNPSTSEQGDAFIHQPLISADLASTTLRESELGNFWWWQTAQESTFTLLPSDPQFPVTSVSGELSAPSCGPRPITATLTANGASGNKLTFSITVIATPDAVTPFELTLPELAAATATLIIDARGPECVEAGSAKPRYAKILNLHSR